MPTRTITLSKTERWCRAMECARNRRGLATHRYEYLARECFEAAERVHSPEVRTFAIDRGARYAWWACAMYRLAHLGLSTTR